MLGDQKRITTTNNLKTINTNIRNIQTYLMSKKATIGSYCRLQWLSPNMTLAEVLRFAYGIQYLLLLLPDQVRKMHHLLRLYLLYILRIYLLRS